MLQIFLYEESQKYNPLGFQANIIKNTLPFANANDFFKLMNLFCLNLL